MGSYVVESSLFMFEAISKINPEMRKSFEEEEELSKQLCQAATKASILAIKLMNTLLCDYNLLLLCFDYTRYNYS